MEKSQKLPGTNVPLYKNPAFSTYGYIYTVNRRIKNRELNPTPRVLLRVTLMR